MPRFGGWSWGRWRSGRVAIFPSSYPKLKQYIGKKDKLVSLFIKGAKNPDELVSYFLPEGKKVNYGKKGIEVDDDSKKRFRSYEEYLQIKKEE